MSGLVGEVENAGRSLSRDGGGGLRFYPWDGLRVAVACLLLVAAGLKAYQSFGGKVLVANSIFEHRWFILGQTTGEVGLALWLVTGWHARVVRRLVAGLFFVFVEYSLYRVAQGKASCGCFGAISVTPWLTFLLDSVVVTSALWVKEVSTVKWPRKWSTWVCLMAGGTALWVGTLVGASRLWPVEMAQDLGVRIGDRRILLQPDAWVGRTFPLLSYMSGQPKEIQHGRWLVVLMNPGCGRCWMQLQAYEERAEKEGTPLVVVWLSDWRSVISDGEVKVKEGTFWTTLEPMVEWLGETPVAMRLVDGRVESVEH